MKAARLVVQTAFWGMAALAVAGCGVEARMPEDGSFDKTLSVTGPVDLDVRTGAGGVRIDTGPSDSVHVVGRILASDLFSDSGGRIRQIEANPPIQQEGNTIRIGLVGDNPLYRNVRIGYEITVPAATRVHSVVGSGGQTIRHLQGPVEAVAGSGGVRIEDTGGDVLATTGSGGLRLTGVRGAVRARAGSGGIRIDGRPVAAWDIRTGSGGITMSVDGETPFDLDASAGSGGISSDQPVNAASTSNKHRLQGRVRGGGARVDLSAGSGGIRIH
jgi:Putative adhesin